MWENCQYFVRPVRHFFTFKKYYSHCPFSCRSWPMGFNLTRSYMCILSRVRDQRTHIHSQWLLWLRIVNYSHAFEREKSKWWRVSDCARGKKNDWLKINSCVLPHQFQFTIYWRHKRQQSQFSYLLTHSDSNPIHLYSKLEYSQTKAIDCVWFLYNLAWQCD